MKLKDYLYFKNKYGKVYKGNCVKVMKKMKSNSIDTIITDPPYGLEFMGKKWDKLSRNLMNPKSKKDIERKKKYNKNYSGRLSNLPDYALKVNKLSIQKWHYKWAKEALRVAKPGAIMLVFGGTRVYHRLTCGVEDAGWEIRDCMSWNYGSGFPKSLDISKAIDKRAGVKREVIGIKGDGSRRKNSPFNTKSGWNQNTLEPPGKLPLTTPAAPEAQTWDGYGTALKPAWEPILLCMKPVEGNFAENALKHGVAGLNIDGGRIGIEAITTHSRGSNQAFPKRPTERTVEESGRSVRQDLIETNPKKGRWPSNFILQHHPDCEVLGTKKVKGTVKSNNDAPVNVPSKNELIPLRRGKLIDRTDKEGNETVEDWNCHPDCPIRILDEQSGVLKSGALKSGHPYGLGNGQNVYGTLSGNVQQNFYASQGGASRFFYCAKASGKEKHSGLYEYKLKDDASNRLKKHIKKISKNLRISKKQFKKISSKLKKYFDKVGINNHPTVKPLGVLQYLCNLTKMPKNNVVLDMFGGSGTTAIACLKTGRKFIIIEKGKNSCRITKRRLKKEIKRLDVKKIEQIKLF